VAKCFMLILLTSAILLSLPSAGESQTVPTGSTGPMLPSLPVTFVRGEDGQNTIRAVRLGDADTLTLDGRLDESIYRAIQPASGFIQQEPDAGALATEDTQVWIFFDDRNIYLGFRCLDSQPDRIVANEMRRDNNNIYQNDTITFIFDTFLDRRTAFYFQTNPLGALRDALVVSENTTNYDWSTVWDVRALRDGGGWSLEVVIPFKSLRYPQTSSQLWGFNVRRFLRGKNEQSLLSPVPRSYFGSGLQRISSAATLVGMEPPPAARNLELKPSFLSNLTTNRLAAPPIANDLDGSFGIDMKYGVTSNVTVDFTYNTDFAQVEIDEQQVNLTRFSLFFPEKRDFFLEGQNVFDFAGTGVITSQPDAPILFFSRRIGLNAGRPVPIRAGGRLTGRVGRTSIGVLNMGPEESTLAQALATNFFVARVKQDILRRSSIGLIATRRTPSLSGPGSNEAYGVDANLAFFTNLQVNSYYARTATPGTAGDPASYRGQLRYNADRYAFEIDRTKVGKAFNPEIGFVRRPDVTRTYSLGRFSPRPKGLPGVRKLGMEVSYERFVDGQGTLESRLVQPGFRLELESSDLVNINYNASYEFLDAPFRIASGVILPIGAYRFNDLLASYVIGPQRRMSGTLSVGRGDFYSGTRTAAGYSGRVKFTPQLAVEPRVSLERVRLPQGNFTTKLAGARTTYTLSPRMFASVLLQYNSSLNTLETNARFRWEYVPGSDLFVVYTDGRDTADPRLAELVNRGFAVKLTRLFRF
jgi:hypothetical protein